MGPMCNTSCIDRCQDSTCTKDGCIGCVTGKHGDYCEQQCPPNCELSTCSQQNGSCNGCKNNEFWNSDCSNKCPSNCNDTICNQDSGICYGCADGFWGSWCNQTCHNQCSKNVCNQINGNCSEGCSSGYWGNDCENKCPNNCSDSVCRQNDSGVCDGCTDGFWGSWCNQTCHNQCSKNVCNQIHGNCSEGCSSGYWGNDCENKCPNNCSDSVCRQNDSGVCDGCTDGFWGSWCNQTCHNQCSNNVCNQINGNCSEGCSSGYWDNHCEKKCPNNCKDGVCRHNDSYCTYGCQPGYYNDVCYNQCGRCASEVCDHKRDICNGGCLLNFWGDYCNHSCPINCFESVCAHGTGICEKGCNTGYRGPNCTEENQSKASVTGDVAVTAGSIVGVIALAVIAVVLIIFVKRRRISKSTHTKPDISENETTFMIGSKDRISTDPGNDDRTVTLPTRCHREDTVIVDKTKPGAVCTIDGATVEDDGQYYNISKTSKEILVDDLKGYIKLQSKDGFHSVFAEILYGSQFAHDVGQRKENVPKNRFISIFPYDHSRVKLQELTEVPNSDYINANYIDSFDSKKVYIAAQGPKQNTIQDMWRMVVQEKCGKIVILTNLIEGQKKKCERYWPISVEKMEIANMILTLKSEEVRPFYTIRNINVSVKRNGETETMSVTQFHFKSWPDHGVADPRQLVVFHRRVTQVKTSLPGPLIVHCSAGVGRTGTFIGLDSLVTYGRLNKRINVSGFVESMRNNRMNMVQNADQLQLLHEALLETLMYPNNSMSRTDFQKLYVQVQKRMSKEYQILQTMLPEYPTEQYSDATLEVNKDKNRNHCILPPNKYRPFISTFVSGTTDYINAVVVSGTVHDTKFLVTQLPLTNTVVDFWRMVYDHDSNVVVLLNPMDAKEKYPSVLPSEDRVIEVGRLNVKLVSKKTILSNITETVLNITQKNCEKKREVMALHTTSWRASEELPPTKKLILDLLTSVSTWQQEKGERPITVQCMNGATCSGLFCAISKIIQQIKFDQEVDIFQAVREMQICRPQFIQNEAQYRFCYDITMEYLNISDNDVYSNV